MKPSTMRKRLTLRLAMSLNVMRAWRPNNAVNPPHSGVTARAYGCTRRAAGRAGYRERWAGKSNA